MPHAGRRARPAETVTVALPARHALVTRDAVAAVLASSPKASLRQVRQALGGGSLADISAMVTAVRGRGVLALRDALKDSPELGGCVVDVLEQLVSQVAQLQTAVRAQQHTVVAKPMPPSRAELRESVEAAVERSEARMVQRLATMTAAIAEVKRLVTATPAAPTLAKDVVATLPATLRGIEQRVVMLTHTIDADRRERDLPVPPPAVAPEIEQLQDQVHRVTQTVDAQFGLVRRVAQAVQAPSTEIEALRGELAILGKHVARVARRLPTPASQVVQNRRPIAPSAPPPLRSPSRPSAVKIRAAVRRTAATATSQAAAKTPRGASGTRRPRQAGVVGRTTPKRPSRVVRAAQGHQRSQRPATPTRRAVAGTPNKQKRTAIPKKRVAVAKRSAPRSQADRKPSRSTAASKAPATRARGAKVAKRPRKGRGRGAARR